MQSTPDKGSGILKISSTNISYHMPGAMEITAVTKTKIPILVELM